MNKYRGPESACSTCSHAFQIYRGIFGESPCEGKPRPRRRSSGKHAAPCEIRIFARCNAFGSRPCGSFLNACRAIRPKAVFPDPTGHRFRILRVCRSRPEHLAYDDALLCPQFLARANGTCQTAFGLAPSRRVCASRGRMFPRIADRIWPMAMSLKAAPTGRVVE